MVASVIFFLFIEWRNRTLVLQRGLDRTGEKINSCVTPQTCPVWIKTCPLWQEPDNLSAEKGWISIRAKTYHGWHKKIESTGCITQAMAFPAGVTKWFPLFPSAGRRRSLMNEWCNKPSGGSVGGPVLLAIAGNSWSHLWAYDLAASAIWRRLRVISAAFPTRDWWFNYG